MSKAPFVLLINPWITDFAAHDLWSKPMGLLVLASLLKRGGLRGGADRLPGPAGPFHELSSGNTARQGQKIRDRQIPQDAHSEKPAPYSDFPRYFYRHGIHPESFRRKLLEIETPDLIWITSIMTYWYPGVWEAVRIVREIFPGAPVWLGGIYASLCTGHAERHSGADLVITSGVSNLPKMITEATGFPVRNTSAWGDFNAWPFPALDLLKDGLDYAPVLTGIGCPFRCPFCASACLQPERARLGAERIYNEIARDHYRFRGKRFCILRRCAAARCRIYAQAGA